MRKLTANVLGAILFLGLLSFTFSSSSPRVQFTQYGIATYYSDLFEGRKTASGEIYKKTELTAAHKSLPYGTVVRITRLDNKKSIKVRINDRGAFNKGRIIDLSRVAAQSLGMIDDGKANVKLEVLNEVAPISQNVVINKAPTSTAKVDENRKLTKKEAKTTKKVTKAPTAKKAKKYHIKGKKPSKKTSSQKDTKSSNDMEIVTSANYKDFDLYKVQVLRPKKKGFGVQVGLLENYDNVFKFIADLQEDFFKNILMSVEENAGSSKYRIILGPFPTKGQAQSYRNSLAKKKKLNGFVIDLSNLAKAGK